MNFEKAPVVRKAGPNLYQMYAEGDLQVSAYDRATLEYAFTNYAHLVPRAMPMTGSQWVAAIARQYDVSRGTNKDVVDAIRKVMLTEQFADDHILYDGHGRPVFRGTASRCIEQASQLQAVSGDDIDWTRRPVADVEPGDCLAALQATVARRLMGAGVIAERDAGSVHTAIHASPFGLPRTLGVVLREAGGPEATLLQRQLQLLQAHPVREEHFSDEQNADLEAQATLMAELVANQGYSCLVAHAEPGTTHRLGRTLPAPPARESRPEEQLLETLTGFVGNLVEEGWKPGAKQHMFLCRPAPLINPLASMQPFESLVHERLIGWRLPQALVRHGVDEAQRARMQEPARQRA